MRLAPQLPGCAFLEHIPSHKRCGDMGGSLGSTSRLEGRLRHRHARRLSGQPCRGMRSFAALGTFPCLELCPCLLLLFWGHRPFIAVKRRGAIFSVRHALRQARSRTLKTPQNERRRLGSPSSSSPVQKKPFWAICGNLVVVYEATVRQRAMNHPGTAVPVRPVTRGVAFWNEPGASSCGDVEPDADLQEQGDGDKAINPHL